MRKGKSSCERRKRFSIPICLRTVEQATCRATYRHASPITCRACPVRRTSRGRRFAYVRTMPWFWLLSSSLACAFASAITVVSSAYGHTSLKRAVLGAGLLCASSGVCGAGPVYLLPRTYRAFAALPLPRAPHLPHYWIAHQASARLLLSRATRARLGGRRRRGRRGGGAGGAGDLLSITYLYSPPNYPYLLLSYTYYSRVAPATMTRCAPFSRSTPRRVKHPHCSFLCAASHARLAHSAYAPHCSSRAQRGVRGLRRMLCAAACRRTTPLLCGRYTSSPPASLLQRCLPPPPPLHISSASALAPGASTVLQNCLLLPLLRLPACYDSAVDGCHSYLQRAGG